jgi:Domain of unknown function (DUF4333)
MGDTVSTPRDFNQRPGAQRPDEPTVARGTGSPQQGGTPWYLQPPADRPSPPQSPQQPPAPYSGAGENRRPLPQEQQGQPSPGPSASTSKASGSWAKRLFIAAAVIAVLSGAAIAVLMVTGVLKHDIKKIAVAGVQTQVQQVLVDRITGYNADEIKDVKCNNGQDPTVKKGDSFNCNVNVRGKQHQLTVTFQDDNGTYEVGLPQLSGGK